MNEFIILDLSPPELNLIILQGTLKFSDLSDIHLKAHYILIHKGRLMVGTQNTPFMHEAVITMLGTRADLEIPVYGAKCIGVRSGTLDLHGAPTVSWTRLGHTAEPGALSTTPRASSRSLRYTRGRGFRTVAAERQS